MTGSAGRGSGRREGEPSSKTTTSPPDTASLSDVSVLVCRSAQLTRESIIAASARDGAGFSGAVATASGLAAAFSLRSHRGSGADTFAELRGPDDRRSVSAPGSTGGGDGEIIAMSMTGATSELVAVAISTAGGSVNSPRPGVTSRLLANTASGAAR